jgi:hypothetical protein
MTYDEKWLELKEHFLKMDEVEKSGESLKIRRKMFVFYRNEKIVVKLPKDKVTELLNSQVGLPYDPGSGKIMKEWVIIPKEHSEKWHDFISEAKQFALTLTK